MYEIYLNLYHNKSLSSVMNTYYNRDILLTSKDLIIKQHADCDKNTCHLEWKHS